MAPKTSAQEDPIYSSALRRRKNRVAAHEQDQFARAGSHAYQCRGTAGTPVGQFVSTCGRGRGEDWEKKKKEEREKGE